MKKATNYRRLRTCDLLQHNERGGSIDGGATETKGSWWPDWIEWIGAQGEKMVPAKGARVPGKGKMKAIEDAPGSYVRGR